MHTLIKPHHFLDLLYEVDLYDGCFPGFHPYGHQMGRIGNLLVAGEVDTVIFTAKADDGCGPDCVKLKNGRCTDVFSPEEEEVYGYDSKLLYSYVMDTGLAEALPEVFVFGIERSLEYVLDELKCRLSQKLLDICWPRPDRMAHTERGIERIKKAIKDS